MESRLVDGQTRAENEVRHKAVNRLAWLERAIVVSLVVGLLLSAKLWVSTRAYPLVPLLGFVPPLPYPLDYLLFALFTASLIGILIFRERLAGALAVAGLALAVLLVLQDQGRLQPWFYQYSFMLGAVGLSRLAQFPTESALNACRVIVASTYLWSGLQKAHVNFADSVYPWLIEPLASYLPSWAASPLENGAYAVPVIEVAIGLGLLARPLRLLAVVGAILMHAFILFTIGPWGHDWNLVVWPWNLAMVAFVLILFWRAPDNPSFIAVVKPGGSAFRAAVLVLFAFMPALNFFGLWDSYLSASLYSGSIEEGYVYATGSPSAPPVRIIYTAMEEMNVSAYPEERVYKKVFAAMWCETTSSRLEPTLIVYGRPEILSGEHPSTIYHCRDVRRHE
ncbi:MAG TPA: hypothetical protein VK869_05340 [Rubrobacteraceae bacterium]|nr:hypothetical protein [Rubrobacteraceae bacterium]